MKAEGQDRYIDSSIEVYGIYNDISKLFKKRDWRANMQLFNPDSSGQVYWILFQASIHLF